jgi:hypothetical protein
MLSLRTNEVALSRWRIDAGSRVQMEAPGTGIRHFGHSKVSVKRRSDRTKLSVPTKETNIPKANRPGSNESP